MSSLAFYIGIYGLTMAEDQSRLITIDHIIVFTEIKSEKSKLEF